MKPKEALIDKIDKLSADVLKVLAKVDHETKAVLEEKEITPVLIEDILVQIHTMNIHKVKVAYFSGIKSSANILLTVLSRKVQKEGLTDGEIAQLIDGRNGLRRALPHY